MVVKIPLFPKRYISEIPYNIVGAIAPTMLYGISLIYLFGNKGIFTTMGLEVPLYGPLGIIISQIL
ncbi:hypothetical protein, partial [Clostridioides difficile]|uniref:hypothetical protein n=1 Tax=Clostridioides difficile TaxID=1496 RepID=UPI000BD02E19